ncbi:MAG: glycosyltransferase [candidate division WOR-3 bacterium]
MPTLLAVLFWAALALVAYSWLLFPLLLLLVVALRRRAERPAGPVELPTVTVAIAARNEEANIGPKLTNTLDLDYPADRLEVLVGSDGSDDQTDAIVKRCPDPRVRLLRLDQRSGKPSVLNRLVAAAQGEAILFTDADVRLDRQCLKIMARRLSDPGVGAVHAHYRRLNQAGHPAEGLFDRYETWLKAQEGRLGAMVGAYGWALLVRKALYSSLPADTILDDALIGVAPFRKGYAVVSEPQAVCWTRVEPEKVEFRRRVRIARGTIQFFRRNSDLLLPRYGVKAWVLFSHKFLRLLCPLFLVLTLGTSIALVRTPFYCGTALVQAFLWATVPLVPLASGPWRRLLAGQYYLFANLAVLVGYWESVFRRSPAPYWERTERT